MTVIGFLIILVGLFFMAISAVGAIRLPDFYTRCHAISIVDTLGSLLILGGLICCYGFSFTTAKLLFILVFIYIANPTITHILIRAALKSGHQPWTQEKVPHDRND